MPEPVHTLSQEQKTCLESVYAFLHSATVYLRAVLPVVGEADEQMLKGLLELGESCMKRLPQYFPELQPLAEERERRMR